MSFFEAVGICFAKYATFRGVASRPEYWFFVLFNVIASLCLGVLDAAFCGEGISVLSSLFSIATLVPGLAVTVRRLHDTDRSGWWMLLALIPILGWIAMLVLLCLATNIHSRYRRPVLSRDRPQTSMPNTGGPCRPGPDPFRRP